MGFNSGFKWLEQISEQHTSTNVKQSISIIDLTMRRMCILTKLYVFPTRT